MKTKNTHFKHLGICLALALTIINQTGFAQTEIISSKEEATGEICQFTKSPTMEEVTNTCRKYVPIQANENQEWNTISLSFMALNSAYQLQMLVNEEVCNHNSITEFNWTIQDAACKAIVGSGNLFNRSISGLTEGQTYKIIYNWQATCMLNTVYPYMVSVTNKPAELLSFFAEQDLDKIRINWTTAGESKNNYFEIEKSTDNVDYKLIETVKGTGESTGILAYSLIDNATVSGKTFYRVKQVDEQGRIIYSKNAAIQFAKKEDQVKIMSNEIDNELYIKYYAEEKDLVILRISNSAGEVILSKPITASFEGLNLYNFTTDEIKPGVYSASLFRSDKTISTRFTKE